jgi:signal recognition particle subunit SRP19
VKDMRKLDKAIIWPVYFDINKSREEGRRVPKNQAVMSPKILELKEAADKLGLQNQMNVDAHFPKAHWVKSGMLLVEKQEAKEAIIKKLAKQLLKIRSQQQPANIKKH